MGHKNIYVVCEGKNTFCLTSVVDSRDGVSVEHAVEEGVGVLRELQDDKKRGIKYSSQTGEQKHARTRASTHARTHIVQKHT